MKNTNAIIGAILIFLLGAVSGAITTHMIDRNRLETFTKFGPAREDFIVRRLTQKLELDSRQQEQIRMIIHENISNIRMIRKQFMPRIHATLEQSQVQITALLNPDQQAKFQKIIEARKHHHWNEGP